MIERLRRHVDTLAGLIGPRCDRRPSTIEAAIAYIEREWSLMGQTIARETYPTPAGHAENLIVEWKGTRRPNEVVIVGAHYDTVPQTPGADDNASAVAVMLEATRLLVDSGRTPKRTLRLIAFANEEPPHFDQETMGSQVHARGCRERGEHVRGMVSLEMLGYFSENPGSQTYPSALPRALTMALPSRANFVGMVSDPRSARFLFRFHRGFKRATKLRAIAVPLPKLVREIRLSDHGPFWDEGFCAMMVTDTSFFRNSHYHMPTDTPDTLDYERMAQVTQGVAGGIAAVAGI